jgi:hypothetical protein
MLPTKIIEPKPKSWRKKSAIKAPKTPSQFSGAVIVAVFHEGSVV